MPHPVRHDSNAARIVATADCVRLFPLLHDLKCTATSLTVVTSSPPKFSIKKREQQGRHDQTTSLASLQVFSSSEDVGEVRVHVERILILIFICLWTNIQIHNRGKCFALRLVVVERLLLVALYGNIFVFFVELTQGLKLYVSYVLQVWFIYLKSFCFLSPLVNNFPKNI